MSAEKIPRLMIVADFPPDEQHGGALRTAELARHLPPGSVCWFSFQPLRTGNLPAGLEAMRFGFAAGFLRRPSRLGLSKVREMVSLRWIPKLLARRAAAFGREQRVEAVLVVMQEQSIVGGPEAARLLGVPFHATVHDEPGYLLQARLGTAGMEVFNRIFFENYRAAASRDVVCESMRRYFFKKTGSDAVVVIPDHYEKVLFPDCLPVLSGSEPLRIHNTGMVYDHDLLRDFIVALEELRRAGSFPAFEFGLSGPEQYRPNLSPWPASAKWLGWHDDDQHWRTIRGADFLYLQHPFDEPRRLFAETSFPGKLSAYIRTAVPILFHAPEWSAVTDFARSHSLPFLLCQNDPREAAVAFAREYARRRKESASLPGYESARADYGPGRSREPLVACLKKMKYPSKP